MSKFKVGDKVRVIKLSEVDLFDFKMCEELKISRISEKFIGNSYVYFFNCKTSGLYEEQLELAQQLDPKKTYTIQEVLVEENIGKKFEFNTYEYECVPISSGKLSLLYEEDVYVEDEEYLFDILNGTFTLIEEPKEFTEEIGFKEAFERLCVGLEVKFEISKGCFDIFKIEKGVLKHCIAETKEYCEATCGISTISDSKYTKYYKK